MSLESILEELRTKNLINGQLKLYYQDELMADHFMSDIPMLTTSQRWHLDLGDSHQMICKITPKLFLEITCEKSEMSLGILRAFSNQVSNAIRNSALKSN